LATLVQSGPEYQAGVTLLEARYPQYATLPLAGRPIIVIQARHITSWQATPP